MKTLLAFLLFTFFHDCFHKKFRIKILDVLRIDDKKFSVTVNMYFSVVWNEERLVIKGDAPVADWLPIDMDFLKV